MKKERIAKIIDQIDETYINEAVLLEKPENAGRKGMTASTENCLFP